MFSHKILKRFSITVRIKSKFYKVCESLHFPRRALLSAAFEYLQIFKYITFLWFHAYYFLIIFFPESPGLSLTYTSSCRLDCS